MDNITQWVIWWSLYTLITGKRSNKQFRLGAGIANIPDLDVFVGRLLPLSPIDAQFFHRGIMHSIIFNIWVAFALWYVLYRSDKTVPYWRHVIGIFVSILFWHLLVDGMTSYGMRYWLPFSSKTYSTDNIFVVDFGMWIITIAGLIWYMISQAKQKIAKAILIAAGSYFAFTFLAQWYADSVFHDAYPQRKVMQIESSRTLVEPLQPFLRRHIIKTNLWYYEWYYSLFDKNKDIDREFVSSNKKGENLIESLSQQDNNLGKNLRQINSFSRDMTRVVLNNNDWYTIENMTFWPLLWRQDGEQKRMFNFSLEATGGSYIINFDQWDRRWSLTKQTWNDFWRRVWGTKA